MSSLHNADTIPEIPAVAPPDEKDRVPGPIPAGQARVAMLAALANLTHAVAEAEAVSMTLARQLDAAPLCMCCHTLEERRAGGRRS
jgi:hypothetical protein